MAITDSINKAITYAADSMKRTAEYYVNSANSESISDSKKVGISTLNMSALSSIEGLPYQFLPSVDRRIQYNKDDETPSIKNGKVVYNHTSNIGRKYNEKILDRMPLLFLMPCVAKFRSNKETAKALSGSIAEMAGISKETLQSFFNEDGSGNGGRYFETQFAYHGYYQHLQTMLSVLASYLGILNEKVYYKGDLVPIGEINWYDYTEEENEKDFAMYFSGKESIAFYLDGFDTVSESFDNDTTRPSIASEFDNVSAETRELRFLFSNDTEALSVSTLRYRNIINSVLNNVNGGLTTTNQDGTSSFNLAGVNWEGLLTTIDKYINSDIYKDLMLNSSHTIYQGGRVLFPEIWDNSQYNKSYNLNIKLRSPDHDKVSIFMNILVPYCKLLALVLPHATSDVAAEAAGGGAGDDVYIDPNTYFSPYLVKAYSKGAINIDMGIIESLSVTKGATCQWTVDGLPTQLDIDLSIKDLYNALAMSGWNGGKGGLIDTVNYLGPTWQVVSNVAYMDFLANMAGLNVKDTHKRKVSLFFDLAKQKFKYTGANIRSMASNYISNKIRDFYENF